MDRGVRRAVALEPESAIRHLAVDGYSDPSRRVPADAFRGSGADVRSAGLYAWFTDESGAGDLAAGLGHVVLPGLIYAGQAGALFGRRTSIATLHSRIATNHLGGSIRASTFRLTLAAALGDRLG